MGSSGRRWLKGMVVATGLATAPSAFAHGVTHVDPPPAFPGSPAAASAWSPISGPTIPDRWCGTVRATDDTEHEHGPLDRSKIKVGIALMEGEELDRKWLDVVQNHARLIYEHMLAESGGRKSIRFDLGTDCGPGYLDIAVVHVARASNTVGASEARCPDDFAVQPALESKGRAFNFLAYYLGPTCGGTAGGHAPIVTDTRPGASNGNNTPGRMAVVYGDYPGTALHEVGHTLGAVQLGTPHTDGSFHCWDHADIMCYPYTSSAPQSPVRPCEWGKVLDPFDCGKDDYFSPDPAPGSYLDTHWNLYDSVFLCVPEECVPQPPPPTPPAPDAPVSPVTGAAAPAPAPAGASRPARRAKPSTKRCRRLKTRRARARCVRRAKRRAGR